MHSLFFGGMSQYFYQDGILMQDNNVPFVKTISLLTRFSDSSLTEFQLPLEMPGFSGASAEFIPNNNLPHYPSEIIKLSRVSDDAFIIGHIYGGISSPSMNPFTVNQTNTTSADTIIYAVKLTNNSPVGIQKIDGKNPYSIKIYPNPTRSEITFELNEDLPLDSNYFISNSSGQLIGTGDLKSAKTGSNTYQLMLDTQARNQTVFLTVVIENKFFITNKVILK
jgi:hypothetical protein